MELYIKTSFWLGIIGMFIRLLLMTLSEYPRTKKESLSGDIATFLFMLVFVIWAGIVLWVE